MRLVIDANVLISDFQMAGSKFRFLIDHLDHSEDVLCVPEIVFDETIRKFRVQLGEAIREVASGVKAVSRLTGKVIEPPPAYGALDVETESYRKKLRERLTGLHATLCPYPAVTHAAVVGRLFANRRPFNDSEKGYRDCLLWETFLDVASKHADVALVTDNVKDFADEGRTRLHPHLLEDLAARGIAPGGVAFFAGLEKLLELHVRPRREQLVALASQINEGHFPKFNLTAWLEQNLPEVIGDHEPEGFGAMFSEVKISGFDEIRHAEVHEATRLGDAEVLLDLIVVFGAECDFFIEKTDYHRLEDEDQKGIAVDDPNWNDRVMSAGMSCELEARLSVTLNTQTGDVTSSDVWEVERSA